MKLSGLLAILISIECWKKLKMREMEVLINRTINMVFMNSLDFTVFMRIKKKARAER